MVKGRFFFFNLDMREISEQRKKQVDKTAEWIWPGLLMKEGKLARYRE